MMITLIPPNFVLQEVTQDDLAIASLAWGFTIGFGWLTTWTAIKQTRQVYKRHGRRVLRSAYIWMIWLEILVCLIFSIICWLYLKGIIPPSFAFYFCILTTWALQVQFLLQIIINRCSILLPDRKKAYRIKVGVAILITAVNISVYNIWIPARLQVSDRYIWINDWWDRCEKVIYLIVDGTLNFYFIRVVQRNLVSNGLTKYKSLVKFNKFLVGFSLSMDVLIISMMSLNNTFVYMQFHPFAYIVKLKIEMSMADLIRKVARSSQTRSYSEGTFGNYEGDEEMRSKHLTSSRRRKTISVHAVDAARKNDALSIELRAVTKDTDINSQEIGSDAEKSTQSSSSSLQVDTAIYTTQEIRVEIETPSRSHGAGSVAESFDENGVARRDDYEARLLRHNELANKKGMGTYTKIWGSSGRLPPPS